MQTEKIFNPASVFKKPQDIIADKTVSHADKIAILKQWAYDEREKSVAEEENMQNPGNQKDNLLDEILKALLALGVEGDEAHSPPTKQG